MSISNLYSLQGASEKKVDAGDGNEQTSDGQQPRKEETGVRKSSKGQQKENVSEDVDVDACIHTRFM